MKIIPLMTFFAVCCTCAFIALGCGASLTPADQQAITQDTSTITSCQAKGLACQASDAGHDCYGVYDACMKDAGL